MAAWKFQLAVALMAGLFAGEAAWAVSFDNPVTAYAVNRDNQSLYSIDMESGLATLVGAVGFNDVRAIAFDTSDAGPNRGVLYGVDAETDQLITIDTTTGAGTAVPGGGLGVDTNQFVGMTFDQDVPVQSAGGSLLMLNWTQDTNTSLWDAALYTLDPSDGSADFLADLVGTAADPIPADMPFITDIASVNPLFGGNTGFDGSDTIDPDTGEVGDFISGGAIFAVPEGANMGLSGVNAPGFPFDGVVFGVEDITDRLYAQELLRNVEISTVMSAAGESVTFDNLAIGPDEEFSGDLNIEIIDDLRAVPEPATAMLGLMGLSALGTLARRRVA